MSQSAAKPMNDAALETSGALSIPYAKIAIGLLVMAVVIQLGRKAGANVPLFAEWVETLGPWGRWRLSSVTR